MFNPRPEGHVWPRMAMNVAQHKIVNLLKTLLFIFLLISFHLFVYLMCGPRQLVFHCSPEMTKGWTPQYQVNFCERCKNGVQFHSFACVYPILPTLFLKRLPFPHCVFFVPLSQISWLQISILKRYLPSNVHCHAIHNSQDMETL